MTQNPVQPNNNKWTCVNAYNTLLRYIVIENPDHLNNSVRCVHRNVRIRPAALVVVVLSKQKNKTG